MMFSFKNHDVELLFDGFCLQNRCFRARLRGLGARGTSLGPHPAAEPKAAPGGLKALGSGAGRAPSFL